MKIFVINPGSTSTKLALYEDENPVWTKNVHHPVEEIAQFRHINEQYEYRKEFIVKALNEAGIPLAFDAVIARGGLLKPTPGGVYAVNERMKHDLIHATMEHASNLGALIADELSAACHCPAYIADPVVVDERMPEARWTGIPGIERVSIFHALNSKAVSRRYAASLEKRYEDLNLIVVHLGGGISVSAHRKGRVIDVNNALDGDGPFSPERAGTVPAGQLAELCFSGKYTLREVKKMLSGKGGLNGHLGETDMITIAAKAEAGEEPYKSVLDAMMYTIAKEAGARYVALRGQVDAIIVTGGIAHSKYCVGLLKDWIDCLGPIVLMPGEDEMWALAYNALGALQGNLELQVYQPE
ncbi:MAG: butyrate kinase [Bacteroidaceae bacterium]|nr:butyrate kinase [Bacteroidaceae bacterium]